MQYRGGSYLIPIDAVFHAEDESITPTIGQAHDGLDEFALRQVCLGTVALELQGHRLAGAEVQIGIHNHT